MSTRMLRLRSRRDGIDAGPNATTAAVSGHALGVVLAALMGGSPDGRSP